MHAPSTNVVRVGRCDIAASAESTRVGVSERGHVQSDRAAETRAVSADGGRSNAQTLTSTAGDRSAASSPARAPAARRARPGFRRGWTGTTAEGCPVARQRRPVPAHTHRQMALKVVLERLARGRIGRHGHAGERVVERLQRRRVHLRRVRALEPRQRLVQARRQLLQQRPQPVDRRRRGRDRRRVRPAHRQQRVQRRPVRIIDQPQVGPDRQECGRVRARDGAHRRRRVRGQRERRRVDRQVHRRVRARLLRVAVVQQRRVRVEYRRGRVPGASQCAPKKKAELAHSRPSSTCATHQRTSPGWCRHACRRTSARPG